MGLKEAAKRAEKQRTRGPVWQGPAGDGPQGGVTQSLLGRYLGCKERFRLRVMDGWTSADRFNSKMEFGNMWHVCEEALAAGVDHEKPLVEYAQGLAEKYRDQQQEVEHWCGLAVELFPRYRDYWAEHPDVKDRTPLLQEQPFDVRYELPSGREVRLRGKWDSVDLIGRGKGAGVYVQENKTKSKIDSVKIARQCSFDLQTMMYLEALWESQEQGALIDIKIEGEVEGDYPNGLFIIKNGKRTETKIPILGVRYNCIRRPQHKTVESAMKTFGVDSRNGRIGEWFARWKIEVGADDLLKFRRTCLDPVLENLLDDYEWWAYTGGGQPAKDRVWEYTLRQAKFPHHQARHFRYPFGVYAPLMEGGGETDMDYLVDEGSTAGLRRIDNLFPELS